MVTGDCGKKTEFYGFLGILIMILGSKETFNLVN
jgi:hypothetical protein